MNGSAAVQQEPPAQREASADRCCDGCDGAGHEVGALLPCRITFKNGSSAPVAFCRECLEMAELGVKHPGASYGAAALPNQIIKVERLAIDYRAPFVAAFPRPLGVPDVLSAFDRAANWQKQADALNAAADRMEHGAEFNQTEEMRWSPARRAANNRLISESRLLRDRADAAEREARAAIADDTLVDFDGAKERWGDLPLQDRKAYLAGGYPF